MTETLPDRLDRLMREAGYNPRSLSLRAGLGITAVRDIIDGRIASPRYQTLEALARVLGVAVGRLANGAADQPADSRTESDSPRTLPVFGAAQGGNAGAM